MFSEADLQNIWKNQLFKSKIYFSSLGQKIEIIKVGELNKNSGADFSNAIIKIDDLKWVGDVEIHINSSDWFKHKHHQNKAYDKVILHIVYHHDKVVTNTENKEIPTIILDFDSKILTQKNSFKKINIAVILSNLDEKDFQKVIDDALNLRLEKKSNIVLEKLKYHKNDWQTTFYECLAKNFGFKINDIPFELLAQSLPQIYIAKHKNNLLQIEAFLFGQAGFLNQNYENNYLKNLKKEYIFLKKKFSLTPLNKEIWKFSKLRVYNSPIIRIAQFASLIYLSNQLFSKIINESDLKLLQKLFKVKPSLYWQNHYFFEKKSKFQNKHILGEFAIQNIIINTIIPFWIAYGKSKKKNFFLQKTLKILKKLKAENNFIINKFKKNHVKIKDAYTSQAILEIYKKYK